MEGNECFTYSVCKLTLHEIRAHSTSRNVPGVALYMAGLTHLRTILATSPYFTLPPPTTFRKSNSVLPKLTAQGNLIAGATARVTVGFILNPFSVIKARFEVRVFPRDDGTELTWKVSE